MAGIVLFHHVLGLTDGVRAFAERLAGDEHTVHIPDLYGGEVAASLEEVFDVKQRVGDEALAERTEVALAELPAALVYAGMSLGVMTAQRLAQTRPGAAAPCCTRRAFPSPASGRSVRGPTESRSRSTEWTTT